MTPVRWIYTVLLRPIVNRFLLPHAVPLRVLAGPNRGSRMLIEPRTEKVYWRGAASPAVARALARFLRPGHVFWDIGCHIGYVSLVGSRLVGPTGQVHTFEPLQANVERLREGLRLNAITNIIVHPVAVSDADGLGLLRRHESSHMWSLVENEPLGEEVPCVTLDTMLASLPPPNWQRLM